jgi:nucleoside-diphosphate-sugar epimerase
VRLLDDGVHVRSLDLAPHPDPRVESVIGDIRTPAACAQLCRGAAVLVHAAAALPIHRSEDAIRAVNVGGTAGLLAAALESDVRRAVFLSSGVVYGLPSSWPVAEGQPPTPIDAYGRSKLEAERLCAAFGDRGLEVVVLRPAAVVGPGRLGVFGVLFEWLRDGSRVYTIGDGSNRYQLLAVSDLVEAIVLATSRPVAGAVYNVGAAIVGTVAEELRLLVEHAGTQSRVTGLPAVPARVVLAFLGAARLSPLSAWHYRSADRDVVLDVTRAARELGWRPARSNLEALLEAYDWYVENRAATVAGTGHRTRWDERALGLVRKLS